TLLRALRQLCRERPLEEIAGVDDPEPGPLGHARERPARVAGAMPVHLIVLGPEHGERWNGDHDATLRCEELERTADRRDVIGQVLQNVEHEDEPDTATRRERRIEGADVNVPLALAGVGHQAIVDLDTARVSELT